MMPPSLLTLASRGAISGSVVIFSLLTVSCKLPPRETWSQVQQRGLLPVLFDPGASAATPGRPPQTAAQAPVGPANPAPLRVQAVQQPEISRIPFATPVPGRTGFVFSPHAEGRKVVDVRAFAAGTEVRCPYTMEHFQVPDFSAPAVGAPAPPSPQPPRSIGEVAFRFPEAPLDGTAEPLPMLDPAPAQSSLPAIPYGSRIPGRPGFVNSPFAQKNQLVDVAGIAPGVEVKCPYSNNLFRVPELLPEENVPAPATVIPPAPPVPEANPAPAANPPPESSPPPAANPAPAEAPPSPAVTVPTAAWADQEKLQVQSPFGSPGQWIDVSGRLPGSTMPCPFTNKEFIIPAA